MVFVRIAVVALVSAIATSVSAQPTEDARRARELFEQAVPLLSAQRYAEAHELLVEALALDPRASTAFNLASALTGLSRPLEALDLLERVERGEYGELPARYAEPLATLTTAIQAQLGRLEIRTNAPNSVAIELDGAPVGTIENRSTIQRHVAPGSHAVRGTAEGYQTAEQRVTVGAGERRDVLLELALIPLTTPDPDPDPSADTPPILPPVEDPAPEDEGGPGAGLWIGLGLGAAAIAAGVIITVLLLSGGESSAFMCDPVFGCTDV